MDFCAALAFMANLMNKELETALLCSFYPDPLGSCFEKRNQKSHKNNTILFINQNASVDLYQKLIWNTEMKMLNNKQRDERRKK